MPFQAAAQHSPLRTSSTRPRSTCCGVSTGRGVRLIVRVAAWTGLVLSAAVIALAQGAASPTGDSSAAPTAQAQSGQRSDGEIEMDVVQALDASQPLKDDMITAATIQAEVTLGGTVSTADSKQLAETIVRGVRGVIEVHNNLQIGKPTSDDAALDNLGQDNAGQDNAGQNNAVQGSEPTQNSGSPTQNPGSVDANSSPSQTQPTYDAASPSAPSQQYMPDNRPPSRPPSRSDYDARGYDARGQAPPPSYPGPGSNRNANRNANREDDRDMNADLDGDRAPEGEQMAPMATGPMTIPQGTPLHLRTNEPLNNKRAKNGTTFELTLIHDVNVAGKMLVPRGATVHGVVVESKQAGELGGSSELALELTSLDLGGRSYPLMSDDFKVKSPSKSGYTARNVIGGTLMGAIIGGAVGRGPGAAIGAVAGAGAGTVASAATPGPNVWIPSEAQVIFHLAAPITVDPVSPQEAQRLAQGLYAGGPALHQRGGRGYPPPGYPPPGYPPGYAPGYGPGYPPPPPYYRPYAVTGGYYYWR